MKSMIIFMAANTQNSSRGYLYLLLAAVMVAVIAWFSAKKRRHEKPHGVERTDSGKEQVADKMTIADPVSGVSGGDDISGGNVDDGGNDDIDMAVVGLLKTKVKNFAGCFNLLSGIAANGKLDMEYASTSFDDVAQILNHYYGEEAKVWYSDFEKDRSKWSGAVYKAKAAELMRLLVACGVKKSDEKSLVWSEDSKKYYARLNDVADGMTCHVVSPYWTYGIEVLEKGLVSI